MADVYQKIDIFPHILPPKYKDALLKALPANSYWQNATKSNPPIYDVEARFKIMDKFPGIAQVLTISSPPIESVLGPEKSVELAKIANDGMAELVQKYPDRFIGAAACLPMNNLDASLMEIDRAIKDLGLKGVQIHTPINDTPLDLPEYLPIYEKMSKYNLPIWIHPHRAETYPDYHTESESKYRIFHRFGWPYETSAAMTRLVFSGILEKYSNLHFITHHCGGMIPYFASRIASRPEDPKFAKPMIEYFKMFYGDTANIETAALTCGFHFFGAAHLLFGTDMPYGGQNGEFFIRHAVTAIDQMEISEADKKMIYSGNARKLLQLPV
jgi:uncharacterized protein